MTTKPDNQFAQHNARRKSLVMLAGLLACVLIANGVVSLFALHYSNEQYQEGLQVMARGTRALECARSAQVHFKKQVQEWKNILLRGSEPQDFARYQAAFELEERLTDDELKRLLDLVHELELSAAQIEQVRMTHTALGADYRKALQEYRPADSASAAAVDRKVRGIDRAPTDQMDAIVDQVQVRTAAVSKKVQDESLARYQSLRKVSIAGTAVAVVIVFVSLGLSFAAARRE